MTTVERLLLDLIALPSINPAFLPAGHPLAGEKRVAEYLGARATRVGLEVVFEQVFPERANVLMRLSPPGPDALAVSGRLSWASARRANQSACRRETPCAPTELARPIRAAFGKKHPPLRGS